MSIKSVTVVTYVNNDPNQKKVHAQEYFPMRRERFGPGKAELKKAAARGADKLHLSVSDILKHLDQMVEHVERIQDDVDHVTRPLRTDPEAIKTVIRNIHFTVGNNVIKHGLGKSYSGWRVIRPRQYKSVAIASAPGFCEVANANSSLDKDQVTIKAFVECVADLEIW